MSLNLTAQDVDAIWTEAEQHCPPATSIDRLETIRTLPSRLGSGYAREIELCSGLELRIFNEMLHEDLTLKGIENSHLVQFKVLLSGIEDSGDHVLINADQSYIGGSGIQRCLTVFTPGMQPAVGVDIHLQPHLLHQANDRNPNPDCLLEPLNQLSASLQKCHNRISIEHVTIITHLEASFRLNRKRRFNLSCPVNLLTVVATEVNRFEPSPKQFLNQLESIHESQHSAFLEYQSK